MKRQKLSVKRAMHLFAAIVLLNLSYTNCGKPGFQTLDPNALQSVTPEEILAAADLKITSQPEALISKSDAQVSFEILNAGSAPGLQLKCYLDSVAFASCQSPLKLTNLSEGEHHLLFVLEVPGSLEKIQKPLTEKSVKFRVDRSAPLVSVTAPPAVVTTDALSIAFTAADNQSGLDTVTCSLDGAAFANCVSPVDHSNLAAGNHSFVVKATDKAGNTTQSAPIQFRVDLNSDVPSLSFTLIPAQLTSSTSANFEFKVTGKNPIQSTQCQLDTQAFTNCSMTFSASNLSEGTHKLTVKVTDSKGLVNSLTHEWTVDRTPPALPVLSMNVTSPSKASSLNLTFSATDSSGIAKYECKFGSATYAACTSPQVFSSLADGSHTLSVRAQDKAGNMSAEASVSVVIDTQAPVITLSSKPTNPTSVAQADFAFSVVDASGGSGLANISCQLNSSAAAACTTSVSYTITQSGMAQTFKITATDKAGNSITETYQWTYNAGEPLPPVAQNARYVSTTGNDGNSGLTPTMAWRTLKYASAQAKPGQTIYVKAGNYGKDPIKFAVSGTAAAPIAMEGYRTTPGDSPTIADFDHTSSLDASVMPLIDGGNRATAGVGVEIFNRNYMRIKNLQVTRFNQGVYLYAAQNNLIENVIVTNIGDTNDDYNGTGIVTGEGYKNVIKNSVVVNAAAEGIMIYGDSETITGCRVYASDNTSVDAAMDYYMLANGKNHVIENSLIHRVGNLPHGGHGIGVKSCATNNIIRNNKAINISGGAFYVRHRGAKFNRFTGNIVEGGTGYVARDGASQNIFEDGKITGASAAISFFDTTEDEGDDKCDTDTTVTPRVLLSGVSNTFKNILIENTTGSAIHFSYYVFRGARAHNNVFDGLTIKNSPLLFHVEHVNYDNVIKNSNISGVTAYSKVTAKGPYSLAEDPDNNISLNVGVTFQNNTFSGNGFANPTQTP